MATPNYGYEKRQRELAKKQKKEDKARAKALRQQHGDQPGDDAASESEALPSDGAATGEQTD